MRTRLYFPKRYVYPVPRDSECGKCPLDGPDEFGNYDLVPRDDCPLHGGGGDRAA